MIDNIKERFIILNLIEERTEQEQRQLTECKRVLRKHYEKKAWQLGRNMNFLRMAHQTNDWDWIKKIGSEMEQMREGDTK